MQTYCVSCKKNTGNTNPKIIKTKNGRLRVKSNCSVCGKRKSEFVFNQKASGILSSLGNRTPLSKISGLNILY